MYVVTFVLWIMFDAGRSGIQIKTVPDFVSESECNSHAETAKTIMMQPKYVRYVCAPKRTKQGSE